MKITIRYILLILQIFGFLSSCKNKNCSTYDLDFIINGKDYPTIIYGIPSEIDSNLCCISNIGEELELKTTSECKKLIWKVDDENVNENPIHKIIFDNSGIHKIELQNRETGQLIRKYVLIRTKEEKLIQNIVEKTNDFTHTPQPKSVSKSLDCDKTTFYVSESEGTIYDLPSGTYTLEINEEGIENTYKIQSNGEEISFKWKKRHYPTPKNYTVRIKDLNGLICKLKQSN